MNCTNCGAPLTPIQGRDYLACQFCSTFHFPKPLERSADGVIPLGQRADAECPVCGIALSHGSIERCDALYCEQCRGLLLDGEDFSRVVGRRRAKRTGPCDEPRPLNPEELQRIVNCPVCHRRMDVHPYYGPGNVVVDSCAPCRLIWLDHGEIGAIERAPGRTA